MTPQGLKDIFCRLKLLAGMRRPPTQKHSTHCNKGHFTCGYGGAALTQKESLCFSRGAAMVAFYKPGDFFSPSQAIEIVVSGLRWRLKAWPRKCLARCGTELEAQARQGVCCCFAAFYRGRVGADLAPRSGPQVAGGGAVQTAPPPQVRRE